jgi:hypothetical protein
MFEWLELLRREHALPDDPSRPARVDFVGKVLSPNTCTSPITRFHAALIDLVLLDRETLVRSSTILGEPNETYAFTQLGASRYGSGLVIADERGRDLYIESARTPRVVPMQALPLTLDSPVPPELAGAARLSHHLLSYRETRFCEGDRVRVIATVTRGRVGPQAGVMHGFGAGGYRDASASVLVPVDGERLELRELL